MLLLLAVLVVAAAALVVAAIVIMQVVPEPTDKGNLAVIIALRLLAALVVAALVKKVPIQVLKACQKAQEDMELRTRLLASSCVTLVAAVVGAGILRQAAGPVAMAVVVRAVAKPRLV